MFSIIIPVKNEEKIIGRTLKQFSGLNDVELIVSDGNSTDKTVVIAKQFTRKVIVSKHSHTIAEARNLGAQQAIGDILVFLDADVVIPDIKVFFARMQAAFKNPKVVAATVAVNVSKDEETTSDKIMHWILNTVTVILGGGRGECQVIRKITFNKIGGFNQKLVASEDYEIFSRLRRAGKVKYMMDLNVYESPRRFRKLGYLKVYLLYMSNYLSVKLRHKAFSRKWEPVR